MSLIVQKYGGSSVATVERLYQVARRIARTHAQGDQVVVVVSAQGNSTDQLIRRALEVSPRPSDREMDMLLATGEQASVALLAMALQRLGCPALSLCGWQAGIFTDSRHQSAAILQVEAQHLLRLLERGAVVIVAGFQGVDAEGDITTLGRGGSDTTAVALAAALEADRCQIYTDVAGVYTADPNVVPQAKKLPQVSYNDMLLLASLGAKVLHDRSVELAKKAGVPLEVLSSFEDEEGSLVWGGDSGEPQIRGLAADSSTLRWHLEELPLEEAGRLMTVLYRLHVRPDLTEQPGPGELTFTTAGSCRPLVEQQLEQLGLHAQVEDSWAKVTAVGHGLPAIPGLEERLLNCLAQRGILVEKQWLGERRLSFLLPREQGEEAIRLLHRELFEEPESEEESR